MLRIYVYTSYIYIQKKVLFYTYTPKLALMSPLTGTYRVKDIEREKERERELQRN